MGQHFLKFPGFENSPAGFSIMAGEKVCLASAIFLLSAVLELAWREDPSGEKEPGNLASKIHRLVSSMSMGRGEGVLGFFSHLPFVRSLGADLA